MDEADVSNALWWVWGTVAFLAYQVLALVVRRGQWASRPLQRHAEPPPVLFGAFSRSIGVFLLDLVPLVAATLPMVAAAAWLFFCAVAVARPLAFEYGTWEGIAGGLLLAVCGMTVGVSVLIAMSAEERKRSRDRDFRTSYQTLRAAGLSDEAAQAVVRREAQSLSTPTN